METVRTDILVIGSGAAGLLFALKAADSADVLVITKKEAPLSNTNFAQGGVATVIGEADSFELHIGDTIAAGRGLCHEDAVEVMVREGPARIRELLGIGVRFNRDEASGALLLGSEGGHSAPRIVHFDDVTGREIEDKLVRSVLEHERIEIVENILAIDLVLADGAVRGVRALDRTSGRMKTFLARHTVLATGGAGKIYLYTSNPDIATGDGIAMAYEAGASIANLEFVQFHPTCLYHPDAKSQLISEAMRGEGAVLRTQEGREFMRDYDPRAELAPRDVVARAIDQEMKSSGDKFVLLDISHRPSEWIKRRFPYIYATCLQFGIDIGSDPIPVVPAAHYMCGGVRVDINGKTDLPGLSAIGEVACSGVHGANRLASNSILEAIVMAARCAGRIAGEPGLPAWTGRIPDGPAKGDPETLDTVIVDHDWDLARRIMWDYVGIVRSDERLGMAAARLGLVQETVKSLFARHGAISDLVELRNIVLVSGLVVESARSRKESRGLHYTVDYPRSDPAFRRDTVIRKG
ncbi:MAG: L-aspartate oxidase [Candidatus Krumholzibacteriota bacterium]|nr:L-aspartate oxidase [Candidatus Krumholzibacteriota bacterium]